MASSLNYNAVSRALVRRAFYRILKCRNADCDGQLRLAHPDTIDRAY